jgi:hypothetical protein
MTRNRTWYLLLILAIGFGACNLKTEVNISISQNNMKQIGLAFHKFHETHKHLPAADSNGNRKDPNNQRQNAGLSWRVYLLPYMEEQALFNQFKLDEPWDSLSNKKLISKMPSLFANPNSKNSRESGKTSIHVFVGKNNTPFSVGTNGSRFNHITDGTSNTLMAVVAGDDKAEIWTKPGGLPFDPNENPIDLLGKLPADSFLALFCDGYVRQISTKISSETLRNLIQHKDGKVERDLGELP